MKQFAIIGLGGFGYDLATHLYAKGHDVAAIDIEPSLVQKIKDRVTLAVAADGADRNALEEIGVGKMDAVIVGIGTDLTASILTTLNLIDIGVKRIVAKATNEAHNRILSKIGASEIIHPERDTAISLAERLHNPNMLDYLPFIEGYGIINLSTPAHFVGKKLMDLNLINRYGVQVLAVREAATDNVVMIPKAQYLLKKDDIMILLGPDDAFDQLKKFRT